MDRYRIRLFGGILKDTLIDYQSTKAGMPPPFIDFGQLRYAIGPTHDDYIAYVYVVEQAREQAGKALQELVRKMQTLKCLQCGVTHAIGTMCPHCFRIMNPNGIR